MTQGQHSRSQASPANRKGRETLQGAKRQVLRKMAMVLLYSTVPSVLFYTYLNYSETGRLPTLQEDFAGFAIAVLVGLITGTVLYSFNKVLDRWLPWINYFTSRFLLGLTSNVIVAFTLVITSARALIQFGDPDIFWNDGN